ncbi:MAG: TetR/AcrR family transcriptional regulator [Microthrixaceae bacterium]
MASTSTGSPAGTGADRKSDTPQRARGRATRARLMKAGVAVFSRKGFHATRVDDIAKRAKTSHGTFYLYFSSKEELFEELVSEVAEEFHSLTDGLPSVRDTAEGRAALEAWLASFIELYRGYGPLIRSWTDAESPGGADGPAVPDLLGRISAELADNVFVPRSAQLDPDIAALVVVAMVERVNYFLATDQIDHVGDLVSVLASIALDAFFGPGH